MKKLILLISIVFLVTGCNADYNLEIGPTIKEEIIIPYNNSNKDKILEKVEKLPPVIDDFNNEYKYNIADNGNNITLSFNYNNQYKENVISRQCFQNLTFKETEEYVNIKASGEYGCLYDAESVNINIKTDYFVQDNNSDSSKDNIYTWNINSNNRDNVDINILMNKKVVYETTNSFANITKFILFIGVFLASLFFYKKYEEKRINNS